MCTEGNVYYSLTNPSSDTNALNNLCGNGVARSTYLNASSLSAASVIYTDSNCSTLASGPRYYSDDNITYYYWSGYSLQGPYTLNCP